MSTANFVDIEVCIDCYSSHHSGALETVAEGGSEPLSLLQPGEILTDNTGENEEGIIQFSDSSCDGCGSRLAGPRYRMVLWF